MPNLNKYIYIFCLQFYPISLDLCLCFLFPARYVHFPPPLIVFVADASFFSLSLSHNFYFMFFPPSLFLLSISIKSLFLFYQFLFPFINYLNSLILWVSFSLYFSCIPFPQKVFPWVSFSLSFPEFLSLFTCVSFSLYFPASFPRPFPVSSTPPSSSKLR